MSEPKDASAATADPEKDKAATKADDGPVAAAAVEDQAAKTVASVDKAALKEQFSAFCKFGDKTADGKTIKLSQSDKWFKQAKVIDGKKITTTDTGIAFRKISK